MEWAIVTRRTRRFGDVNERIDSGVEVLNVWNCADGAPLGDVTCRRSGYTTQWRAHGDADAGVGM